VNDRSRRLDCQDGACGDRGSGSQRTTAGYRLQRARWDVDVFEATNSPGGRVQTVRSDGYSIDTGASALGSTYHSYIDLADELGPKVYSRNAQAQQGATVAKVCP
jgi:protoporphyrinogen oxidase